VLFGPDFFLFLQKVYDMLIQCEGCTSRYFLPAAKVPPKPTKVRCPQCKAVFTLVPQPENVVAAQEPSVVPSAAAPKTAKPAPKAPKAPAAPAAPQAEDAPAAQPSKKAPKRKPSKREKEDARAKRLARVLVSDILCYNQDRRDQALIDGNLMAVLGDEIKKSWELYKEKVGPEIAKSTNYFKDALNEILADGQKVF
jgi:predicted Zn finger-like uncharacterized protein